VRRLLQLLIFLLAFFPSSAAINLALAPKPGMPAEPVFLLTAAFSKLPDVNLLERAELDRILRERALSAASAKDILQAARLLGADAVMFLEMSGPAANQVIAARLAVVSKGAVIHAHRAPWSSAWSDTMLREFGPLIPKTILPPDRAIKLSVLNLRSPGNAAAAVALDREISSLLLSRLSREPELFVLERRNLADLTFEKDLEQSSEQFWTGSHLIDGTVNPNGVVPNVVDLNVRLQTPGSPPQQISLQGARTNLPALIDQLTVMLLRRLNATSKGQWDPASEAAQHLNEAEWALRWKMYEEAQSAADSAWALGLQSPQSASARALAYSRGAAATERQWVHNLGEGLFDSFATVEPGPQPALLETLRISLAFTESTLAQFKPWLTNQQWNTAVNEVLEACGETLNHYYWFPNSRNNEQLPEVRRSARSILNSAMNHPVNRRRFWFDGVPPDASDLEQYYKTPNVFQSATTYTGVFSETPEDALAAYRNLMTGGGFPYVRSVLFGRHPKDPRFSAWRPADNSRIKNLWSDFVASLGDSTNAMLQMEGKFFNLELLPDLPALQNEVFVFLQSVTNTNGLSLYQVPPRFHESFDKISDHRHWANDKIGSGAVTLINHTIELFRLIDSRYLGLKEQSARALLERSFKDHIALLKPYDSALFSAYLVGITDREQARAATNSLAPYLAAITNSPTLFDPIAIAEISGHLTTLETVIARPTPRERMKQMETMHEAAAVRARSNRIAQPSSPPKSATDTNTFVLKLTAKDFWQFPSTNLLSSMSMDAAAPIYRDGLIWFFTEERFYRMNEAGNAMAGSSRPFLVNVNPTTLATNMYSAASRADQYFLGDDKSLIKAHDRKFSFEAIHPYFFLIEDQQFRRLDTRTRKWIELPLPSSEGVLHRVGNRLMLSAASGIFELLESGEKSRVLASVRRRPALTTLDSLETFGKPPPILPGPNGSVRALLNGNAYRFEEGDWKVETHFTNLDTTIQGDHILFHGGPFSELHLLGPTHTSALFIGTPPPRGAKRPAPSSSGSRPMFDLPEQFTGNRVFTVVDGHATIWESWVKAQSNTVPANLLMTVFDPAQPRPLALPFSFDMQRPKIHGGSGNFGLWQIWMAQSETALFLGLPGYNGFWKIPRADLDRALSQARRAAAR
jgi:hypothetical protein